MPPYIRYINLNDCYCHKAGVVALCKIHVLAVPAFRCCELTYQQSNSTAISSLNHYVCDCLQSPQSTRGSIDCTNNSRPIEPVLESTPEHDEAGGDQGGSAKAGWAVIDMAMPEHEDDEEGLMSEVRHGCVSISLDVRVRGMADVAGVLVA